ncbi:hypothetical protein [Clostridium beijerinckii]|jgi:hypothetical protein|uniref:Uncharacterized protein n=2 Tax=Clostridium beijerinckii TaxID=1520 RepID=A0A1S8R2I8_CLOBE|nr:hypothetical protein [Clostridium beijerinckii]ABR36474.1 hypothetical protein Cbei_4364 [Clostridium beijerinckii NCIMB 8052]AIU01409.1 hypothetical protein Cbs_4364 [Clostridium beijerinckii ATCC 35702]MBF7808878.1 hypothetical protein [Clostridium beijerinckii]MCI1477809.1 hypothetical protein [Clostridium beijerinckii]MCI1577875.1 hypothetical protein [Clostridium beijerinckii]
MENDNKNIVTGKSTKAVVTNQISKKNSGLAVVSLVLGIMSIILFWAFSYPIILGLAGMVIGLISIAKKRDGLKIAIAGIITSIIGLLIGIIFVVLYIFYIF